MPVAVRVTPTLAVPEIAAPVNTGAASAIKTAAVAELATAIPGEVPVNAIGITLTLMNLPKSPAIGVYVLLVAPDISAYVPPAVLQLVHW